jgi:hypothetical protein
MQVFVFDQGTTGMIRYILALQRFKEYSVGPQGIRLFHNREKTYEFSECCD